MSVMAGSSSRNPAIFTGIAGAMLGLLLGIAITVLAGGAVERGTSATGGSAALAQAQVFNALHLEREYGNAAPAQVFDALHLEREYGNAAPAQVFNALHLERD